MRWRSRQEDPLQILFQLQSYKLRKAVGDCCLEVVSTVCSSSFDELATTKAWKSLSSTMWMHFKAFIRDDLCGVVDQGMPQPALPKDLVGMALIRSLRQFV